MTGRGASLESLRQRIEPPCAALDFHTHPLADFGPCPVSTPAEDAGLLAAAARRAGISRMVVFSLHHTCARQPDMAQIREANDYALRLRDAQPEVFVPFCYVSPCFPQEGAQEVERCIGRERMAGVKLWVARRASDTALDPIMLQAERWGVPVLQHAWNKTVGQLANESYPDDVADLANRFPRVRIVMAHLNGVNPRGVETVRSCPNVWIDTSGGDPQAGIVAYAVERLGSGRILFGSDAPLRHPAVMLSKALAAGLERQGLRDVLWSNAARLLPDWSGVAALDEAGSRRPANPPAREGRIDQG